MPADTAHHAVIADRAPYLDAVRAIGGGTGPTAIDTERASGYRYSQRAHLIQVHRAGAGAFLFDAPAIGAFDELDEAIGDGEWVIHAATQDLTCLREVGIAPKRLFDTELAARLLGLPRVGLASVAEELLGVHLAKEHSAVDWSIRPLPEAWLEYALLDVEHLVALRDVLDRLLEEKGKRAIAEAEFDAELERDLTPARVDPWRRLSGLHTVRGARGLAVARELWLARDEFARETDTAPGRLVPDASLVAAARVLPASKRDLAGLREFHGRASRSQIDRWWAAIERGLSTEDLPPLRGVGDSVPPARAWAERNPEADARLRAARPAVVAIAEAMEIPVENLLTPDHLRRVAWTPPDPADADRIADALLALGARRWQTDATAQAIADAFVAAAQGAETAAEDDS